MKNTSLTVRDIEDLSFVEFEDLVDGLNKNAEREKEYIKNGGKRTKNAEDLLSKIQAGFNGF